VVSPENSDAAFDYIVVGSGAGGGPLAANLAMKGFRVLLLEAGGTTENYNYQVPGFHGHATEDPEFRWDFFVKHYADRQQRVRDSKYTPDEDGVLYPRASTLGGCTAHNAMITIIPHDSDWDAIAEITGDESWRAANMHRYFERLESCNYVLPPGVLPAGVVARAVYWLRYGLHQLRYAFSPERRKIQNPTGHGYSGWLTTNMADPTLALPDKKLLKVLLKAVRSAARRGIELQWLRIVRNVIVNGTRRFDPNDVRERQNLQGVFFTPLATKLGRRNGTREYVTSVEHELPEKLVIASDCLATQILFDSEAATRAIGVEYMRGKNLYRANRTPVPEPANIPRESVYARREVILCAGAYNSPQLLMLSGIGPRDELAKHGIPVRVPLEGVGRNLQDRYEVGVVFEMKQDFELLGTLTFASPVVGAPVEEAFREWETGKGIYTSNGAVIGIAMRSRFDLDDPDLFIFGLPGYFKGYYPGYSTKLLEKRNSFTWAVLKAHTQNTGGRVTLRSADPRDVPEIVFHYFGEGSDRESDDLNAVVEGILFARSIMSEANAVVAQELVPGPAAKSRDDLRRHAMNEAWGHHASCSNRMGPTTDPFAVVDSRFRVHGTQGLRVVDASVFPRVPGFFIVTAVYMISEKASDVIAKDSSRWDAPSPKVRALTTG
jgi:choline dehydrogenase